MDAFSTTFHVGNTGSNPVWNAKVVSFFRAFDTHGIVETENDLAQRTTPNADASTYRCLSFRVLGQWPSSSEPALAEDASFITWLIDSAETWRPPALICAR